MASMVISFMQVLPQDYTAYNPVNCVKTIYVSGKKMSKAWVHETYGADCNDDIYFINKTTSNPYGRMWITKHNNECKWSVSPIDNVNLIDNIKYDYITVR